MAGYYIFMGLDCCAGNGYLRVNDRSKYSVTNNDFKTILMRDTQTIKLLVIVLTIVYLFSVSLVAYSLDHVKMPKRKERNDLQKNYLSAVLEASLIATVDEYGPYKLSQDFPGVLRERAVRELEKGGRINTMVTTLRDEYIGKVLIVPFPIRRGILSYRLALVHKDDRNIFADMNSADQLNSYTIGLYSDLSTFAMMKSQGYPTVSTVSHHAMFSMLEHKRFEYTFRGVHEIFDELNRLQDDVPNVIVEKSRAFHLFLPTLVFVSPREPRLAERIEKGLVRIFESGKFISLFQQFYRDEIAQSKLHRRKIIKLMSPLEGAVDFVDLPGIWFDPEKDISVTMAQ